jgi:uncharacterized protein
MTFKPGAPLDPSQVEDVRGSRIGGRGVALGGGGGAIGLILIVAYLLLGGSPGDLGALSNQVIGDGSDVGPGSTTLYTECQTGADANAREDCRILGYVNSIQAYWTDEFARSGGRYEPARTRFFTDQISTACGFASSASGPFYCPEDGRIYIDLGFFDDLRTKFGAQGGPLAQAYVLAHEYGHHVQDLAGSLTGGSGGTGPNSRAVQIELQADCLAGVWAKNAAATGYLEPITDAQIADALNAAAAVGDDRIQQQTQGGVNPDSWTHGSAAQRQTWFSTGYKSGNPDDCDTFSSTP